jgi:DMSO/TMAO reductase YedYZ molybdopterin-dependent catalytic subunit
MPIFSRGFKGRPRPDVDPARVPPGQYVTTDFPVLSAGPTPRPHLADWDFTIDGAVEQTVRWTWDEFHELPTETFTRDIHCVTKWTKLDTTWTGISVDTLLEHAQPTSGFVTVHASEGYTTNLALEDITGGKAWVVDTFSGLPLEAEHGGPARLLVPHLYFWKSAKWVRGLTFTEGDTPGFWETNGYNNHGDPWREQRYWGD